ncbi:hypothetical protein REJC140_04044 [Pseudorhizobium endolithicum]|uniref:Transcriptional regulator n=1 Tax=Pseudorhizobium endolithicum TaxID=1191678 RepID=A0ABM8PSJ3_9HYPH|nr:hypothetical protein [Pseudorhizobium endolithicum]CAD6415828.1 hypothetical protein REQ54_01492 [Rhizobium sp. Q54]CAD7046083.1 hypothetical protein REJC140_04044 [Pseudorhizobium endolithicum]
MTATKEEFFKPGKLSAQAKAEQTNAVVRDILAAEATAREKKTEKLKALRLAQPAPDEAPKKRGRKTSNT